MRIESILRRLHPIPGFVYRKVEYHERLRRRWLLVTIVPRRGAKAVCSGCGQRRRGYDTLGMRQFSFVPLWGMPVHLLYNMRRVDCHRCGVKVEMVPWADGKSPMTHALCWFLASWAKALSWKETARRFQTSWDTVFRAVECAVQWGLQHRSLDGITAIGVDELSWKKGQKYLTVVYQVDVHRRRLLHISKDRTAKSFRTFFDMLGTERSRQLRFVVSDMWAAFSRVIKERCSSAVHLLDRFHVMQLMSKAIDQTRRDEVRKLKAQGKAPLLSKTRWILLKQPLKLSESHSTKLNELLQHNLRTVRAYLLKAQFEYFWGYQAVWAARRYLKRWTTRAMRSRNVHFKKLATTLRKREPELLNWFRARGKLALGATEGFNNKARITTRKAYGFRTYRHAEIALYHGLGDLPEPDWLAHKFV